MKYEDLNDNDPEADSLIQAINTNIARDKDTSELLLRAIDTIWRLRQKLVEQRQEIKISADLIDRQQKLLFKAGVLK
jgi:hypothetical protein